MATYKVIQDIEAEDKLLGPLTLRQFIYAAIAAVCFYICFLSLTKHAAFLLVIFLPIALAGAFFAWPWKLNQPTEVWALAKIRFLLKPHQRIWDQSGINELVTITAPKKIETTYTNGLSQTEVKSRLKALADTIDTRGWAIKNVNVNLYGPPSTNVTQLGSDRLIDINDLSREVPNIDVQPSDDMLDAQSNPVAQHFDQMINASTASHRSQIVQNLKQVADGGPVPIAAPLSSLGATPPNDYWFLNQQAPTVGSDAGNLTFNSRVLTPGVVDDGSSQVIASPDEYKLDQELKAQRAQPNIAYTHLHTIQPLSAQPQSLFGIVPTPQPVPQPKAPAAPMTQKPDPDIIALANNNDLNVATLARQANQKQPRELPPDEVVISLH